jgi:hypothetical protein
LGDADAHVGHLVKNPSVGLVARKHFVAAKHLATPGPMFQRAAAGVAR